MNQATTAPRKRRRSPLFSALSGGLTLLLAAMLWLLFAPQALGGQFDYATVRGNSMAPGLVDGDAVLIRRAAQYHVGDAVAARNPDLGVVLHRIIADDGVHFTLQGDNRPARDSYEPVRADIIGKQWARVPHAGRVIRWLEQPIVAAIFGAIVLSLVGLRAATRRPARSGARGPAPSRTRRSHSPLAERLALQGTSGQTIAGSLLLLVICSAVVAVAHYELTDNETITHTLAFTESGRFSYGDSVPGGVYDRDRLAAPEPVFLALVDDLPVTFDYQLAPLTGDAGLGNVIGAHQLVAEISHPNGWTATIPLEQPTLFAGQATRVEGVVHLAEVMDTIQNTEDQTGVTSLFYTLRLVATVTSDGTYGGVPFSRSTSSAIQFRLSKEQLQFDVQESELEPSANVTLGRPETIPRVLPIPLTGYHVPFQWFPWIAFVSLVIAAVGFTALGLATRVVARLGPAAAIRARYGHLLVSVAGDAIDASSEGRTALRETPTASRGASAKSRRARSAEARSASPRTAQRRSGRRAAPAPAPVASIPIAAAALPPSPARTPAREAAREPARERSVIVESFDDLARLAEQRGLAVLTTHHGDIDEYVVIDDDVTYRFATLSARSRGASPGDTPDAPKSGRDDGGRRHFRLAS